jgi:prepilin-type N-terminal cleavage/methylation domain-containing protein/prepilin-type processing-associated H-X9-DG protein
MTTRKKGFTLIELLVVIAIIAILAAILFPVFAKARESGRKAACLSNMKQLALGMVMYATDYDDSLPNQIQAYNTNGLFFNGIGWWPDEIYPYVKNFQCFVCPSRPNEGMTPATQVWGVQMEHGLGYGINSFIMGGNYQSNTDYRFLGLWKDPANRILLTEEMGGQVISNLQWACNQNYLQHKIHNGKLNWGFGDGHAKTLTLGQTIAPKLLWNPGDDYPCYIDWTGYPGTYDASSEAEAQSRATAWIISMGGIQIGGAAYPSDLY